MSEPRIIASMPDTAPAPDYSGDLRPLARVLVAALYMVLQYWQLNSERFPPAHPYRQAALMVLRYLERTYG